jgi:hypothetical protein
MNTEEPRYSYRTLQALAIGADVTRGRVRLLINDDQYFPEEASMLSLDGGTLSVRTAGGVIKNDIRLTRILQAEVV